MKLLISTAKLIYLHAFLINKKTFFQAEPQFT